MAAYPKLKIHVYADGADKDAILRRAREGFVQGFTTNPSLMAKAGVRDYAGFARALLAELTQPISFEVFSDDFGRMEKEALIIDSWNPRPAEKNVYVKIPITSSEGKPSLALIRSLLDRKLKLNVTAIFTQAQLDGLRGVLQPQDDVLVSIFAGRIADTGRDPVPLMRRAVRDFEPLAGARILWASTREALNVFQAEECGCQIITAPDDVIAKLAQAGKPLEECSLDTVRAFLKDSKAAGFSL